MDEDECLHGMVPATCVLCNGRAKRERAEEAASPRASSAPKVLRSPADLEHYRSRYTAERQPTFEAYVDVFFRVENARSFPGGWTKFSRCANAEPVLTRTEPRLVERAEALMRAGGYQVDDSGRARGKGRHWVVAATA
jgi:hypothetical protein